MALTKIVLSASSYGAPIPVTATSIGSGTVIHTANAVTTAGLGDEVVLYASNTSTTSSITLTIGLGGTSTAFQMPFTIGAGQTVQIIPGLMLQNALVVYAAAGTGSVINITGYVLRSQ